MKRGFIVVLGMGIGWVVGINVSMVITFFIGTDASLINFGNVLFNAFIFSFPGFVLFIISIILSLRDGLKNPYREQF